MNTFFKHYTDTTDCTDGVVAADSCRSDGNRDFDDFSKKLNDVLCDEDLIEK